ncbi:MAG TPA: histidine kinase [Flavisolibacter sp.]|jgi:ligand-binding sensor domain-containing protein|nr:histidine kinase [Flavisolibacter sp.]
MNSQHHWLLCLVLIFKVGILSSQPQTSFYTTVYRAEDGLPDSYVLKTFQDSYGYIWIGTYSGLSRFDGKYFTNYGLNNGLPDLFISALAEDSNHAIWIATRKGIGYILNGHYFQTIFRDSSEVSYIYDLQNRISGLWALTTNGIYRYNGKWWEKQNLAKGYENTPCRGLIELRGSVYLNYGHSIIRCQKGMPDIRITSDSLIMPFFTQFKLFHNKLYVASEDKIWSIQGDKLVRLFGDQLEGDLIYSFFEDSKRNFWVALERGGLKIARAGANRLEPSIPLESKLVTGIMEDRDQNLWLCNYRGLLKVNPSFYSIIHSGKPENHHRIFSDSENNLYLYTVTGGLAEWNGIYFKSLIPSSDFRKSLKSDVILDRFTFYDNHTIWATTREGRLLYINREKPGIFLFKRLQNEVCRSVTADSKNHKIYVCASELFIIEHDSTTIFKAKDNTSSISEPTSVNLLSNNVVLVDTRDSGLWAIDADKKTYNLSKQLGLPLHTTIKSYEDTQRNLWISFPGSGLIQCRWNGHMLVKKIRQITTAEGMPNDVIESVIRDDQNRLWIVTLSGIVLLDLQSLDANEILISRIHDPRVLGMNVNVSISSLVNAADGRLALTLYDKVVLFHPERLRMKGYSISTLIEEVKLNLGRTDWTQYAQRFKGHFRLPVKLELPYYMNTLSFDYKGVSFANFNEPVYSYKLLGYDTSWSTPDMATTISFVGLPPGHYDFMVRSRTSASNWSEPAHFEFKIRPPFWNVWWFHLVSVLTGSSLLLFLFRLRIWKFRKNNRLQEQLRELELKALKAQMNPHFIYNALNSIQSLILNDEKNRSLLYLGKFSKLLRIILSHSEKNRVTLDKELSMLRLYIELEELRLNYNFEYRITIQDTILPEKEWIPPMLLQPYVENALWHGLSQKTGLRRLDLAIRLEDELLVVEIKDNGVGRKLQSSRIPSPDAEDVHAMDLLENRLKLWNKEKTSQHVVVKDLFDKAGNPSGTSVVVRIRRS